MLLHMCLTVDCLVVCVDGGQDGRFGVFGDLLHGGGGGVGGGGGGCRGGARRTALLRLLLLVQPLLLAELGPPVLEPHLPRETRVNTCNTRVCLPNK